MKSLLVDLNNSLWRSFSTQPNIPAMSAVYISRLAAKFEVTHIFLAKEGGTPALRNCLVPLYKQKVITEQRLQERQQFFEFAAKAEKILDKLYVSVRIRGYEADDVIGFLAKRLPQEKIVVSTDKDYLQLISDTTLVYLKQTLYTSEVFRDKYGFYPDKFLLYRAMAGDESDNVKGIRGVGKKTAAKLMQQVDTVEELLRYCEKSERGIERKVYEQKEQLFCTLATLKIPAPGIGNNLQQEIAQLLQQKGKSALQSVSEWTRVEIKTNLANVVNAEVVF